MAGYGNRGMGLEMLIEMSNRAYRNREWAVIYKRPTPVKIMRTQGTRVLSAYLEAKSTVDFSGVYRSRALEFEAKSTKEQDRFPLSNVHEHQVEHLREVCRVGAVAFFIVEFSKRHEVYFVPASMVITAWDRAKQRGAPKSIPYDDFIYQCEAIEAARGVPVDYLAAVDRVIDKL